MKMEWPVVPPAARRSAGRELSALSDMELQFAVTQFLLDYCACIDDDRLEQWPSYFTDDGLYEMATRENVDRGLPATAMRCEGMGMLRDRVVSLRHANIYAKQYYRHLVTDVRLVEREESTVRVMGNYLVTRTVASEGDPIVFSVGHTDDLLRLDGQGLRFQRRRVIADNDRIHTLLVLPV
jgi:anthranilate 1,2-dioxygenase small subunit